MREIKFRAWAGNVMVYFNLFNIRPIDGLDKNMHIQRTEPPHFSVSDDCPIMQFTAYQDTQGKDIYDKDILDGGMGRIGLVTWHEDGWIVIWQDPIRDKRRKPSEPYGKHLSMDVLVSKVIGNEFENPELLKQGV